MFECTIRELAEGDILAQPIINRSGMTILEKGSQLNSRYIQRLHELGIASVYVMKAPSERRLAKDWKPLPNEGSIFQKPFLYNEIMRRVDKNKTRVFGAEDAACKQFIRRYRKHVSDILEHPAVATLLGRLYQFDSHLFEHSTQVSIFSSIIGEECDFDGSRMAELVLGSLLSDIGMLCMPGALTRSSGQVSAEHKEQFHRHTVAGYNILSSIEGIPASAPHVALAHHERFDGSGYPLARQGSAIPELARMVAIADSYNTLVSPSRTTPSYRADEAVEMLFASGNYYFDAQLVQVFLKRMKAFPVSSILTLSNGQTGIVKCYSSSIVHRPVVQIIKEANGADVSAPYELDLATSSTITVMHAAI
ncbi:HD domain-containing phosphohydrolase [Paenibacillus sp. PL2-23]|uniref:HD-GYP domain-containing protein n=1 Tax=Paenibacillus sp. PL2-23 TaxID=2100729 RepID=UPI0030F98DDF